jgi:YVTN family beta-propeller protein
VLAAVAALLLTRDEGGLTSVSPNAVGVIDPGSNELVGEVQVGIEPEAIVAGEGGVWVANIEDETVSRIDPVTRELVRSGIAVDGYPADLAVGRGAVWVALGGMACSGGPQASLAIGASAIWFACRDPELGKVNPATGVGRAVGLDAGLVTFQESVLSEFADIAFGLGSLWIVDSNKNTVIEVDPIVVRKGESVTVGRDPRAVAVGDGSLWVVNHEDDTVLRVDVAPGQAPTVHPPIEVGDGPVDVTFGEGAVWVANSLGRSVTRIDLETNEVEATIKLGNEPQRVAAGEGAVWMTVRAPDDAP